MSRGANLPGERRTRRLFAHVDYWSESRPVSGRVTLLANRWTAGFLMLSGQNENRI